MADPNSGCWLWTAADTGRYGVIGYGKRSKHRRAHRVSWELHRGPVPHGLSVLHRCDVTFCVNPNHLFLGTQAENMADCKAKGRNRGGRPKGSKNKKEKS